MAETEEDKRENEENYWWQTQKAGAVTDGPALTPGERCPECGESILRYDSLFVLTCPRCGYVAESGVCT